MRPFIDFSAAYPAQTKIEINHRASESHPQCGFNPKCECVSWYKVKKHIGCGHGPEDTICVMLFSCFHQRCTDWEVECWPPAVRGKQYTHIKLTRVEQMLWTIQMRKRITWIFSLPIWSAGKTLQMGTFQMTCSPSFRSNQINEWINKITKQLGLMQDSCVTATVEPLHSLMHLKRLIYIHRLQLGSCTYFLDMSYYSHHMCCS